MTRALTGTPVNNVVMTIAAALLMVACDINPDDADPGDDAVEIWGFDGDDQLMGDMATTDSLNVAEEPYEASFEREADEFIDAHAVCELIDDAPEDMDALGHCVDMNPVCLFDQERESQA